MATVATLTFDLVANSAKLRGDLQKASKSTTGWATQTRNATNVAGKAFVGASTVGVAALAAIYTQTSKTADRLGKFSDQIGEAPEKIQGLRRAATLTGQSTAALDGALEKMGKRLGEASRGTGEASKYLKEFGLNTTEFFSLSPAEQFGVISDKVNGLSTQQEKAAAASALFSRSGIGLVNTMALGSKGLQDITQEVEDYGLSLTRVDIAKIEAANDAWFRASEVTDGFGQQLTTQLAPLVEALSNEFLGAAKEAGGLGGVATNAINVIVDGVGLAGNSVRGLQVAWGGVKLVVAGVISTIVEGFVNADQALTGFLNALPGVEAKPSEMLSNISDALKQTYDDIGNDLESLLLEPIPSEKLKTWVNDVTAKANAAAVEAASNVDGNIGSKIAEGLITGGANGTDTTQKDFEAVQQSLLTEEQMIQESYARRQAAVAAFYESDVERRGEAVSAALQLSEDMEKEITELRTREAQKQAAAVERVESTIRSQKAATVSMALGLARNLVAGNDKASKALLVIETGLNIARANQNTAAAVTAAMSTYAAAPPGVMEARIAEIELIGAAQIALIGGSAALQYSNTGSSGGATGSFGGFGGSSAGTTSPVLAETELRKESPPTQIIFNGNFNGVDERFAGDFAQILKGLIKDTDLVLIESGTRNARELQK